MADNDKNENGIPDTIEHPDSLDADPRTARPTSGAKDGEERWVDIPGTDYRERQYYDSLTGTWLSVGDSPVKRSKAEGESGGGAGRNDALTAAQAALAGFLQAQTLADARKLAAMENMQKLGQWAVPDGAQHAPNFEPGGLANTAYAVAGMKNFTPPPLQTRRVNPNDVAGDIPPEIRQMIGAVRAAGGA